MGRRRGAADDIIDVVSRLPWWFGLVLAGVFYFVLHHFATLPPDIPPTDLKELGSSVTGTLGRSLASVGQYVLSVLCLLGALVSAIGQSRRKSLHLQASIGGQSAIAAMGWKDFERLTHEVFLRQGYKVTESHRGPDGGVDLQLQKDGRLVLVQCKLWQKDVGVKTVRELHGVVTARRANAGIAVSGSGFTTEARNFAASIDMELIDGLTLEKHVGYFSALPEASRRSTGSILEAACPDCGSGMVIRTARRGSRPGNQFWGCERYPECRGTRQLSGS